MVVRLHRTHEAAAKRAVRLLQVNNIPIAGCLLVGRDSATSGYDGYGYRRNDYRYYDATWSNNEWGGNPGTAWGRGHPHFIKLVLGFEGARAYDYAGDRSRAREAMRRAVELQEQQ